MDEPQFSLALDAIYDAATAFERWPAALDRIGKGFGCSYVGLIDRNLRTMEGRGTAVGIDPAGQRAYFEVWTKHDILRQRTRSYRPGAVETDQDILPRPEFLRSDYYNGFLKPHDMHGYMRMTLSVENGFRKIISLSRPVSLGDFEVADVERFRRFLPHLQRAARVTQQFEESRLMLTAFSGVLESSATGVLLLDQTARIVFANRAARVMADAADSFSLRRERVEVLSSRDDAVLQRLIAGPPAARIVSMRRAAAPCGCRASPASRALRSSPRRWPAGRHGPRRERSRSSWSPIRKQPRCARKR
jgi:PAS domain-containing protein